MRFALRRGRTRKDVTLLRRTHVHGRTHRRARCALLQRRSRAATLGGSAKRDRAGRDLLAVHGAPQRAAPRDAPSWIWHDEALHFATGPGEQKAKNIEHNPACILTTGNNGWTSGLDIVVEGDAVRVVDTSLLEQLAALWEAKLNWLFDVVDGGFRERSSEIAGEEFSERGTAHVFAVAPTKVLAFGKGEPFSQTRYRFSADP